MKPENVTCPECNGPMSSRKGKNGYFWGCNMFPICKGTRDSMGNSKYDKSSDDEDDTWHPGHPNNYGDK